MTGFCCCLCVCVMWLVGWLMRECRHLYNFLMRVFNVFLTDPWKLVKWCEGERKKCSRKPVTRHLSLEKCIAYEVVLQVTTNEPTRQCVTVHWNVVLRGQKRQLMPHYPSPYFWRRRFFQRCFVLSRQTAQLITPHKTPCHASTEWMRERERDQQIYLA